MVEEGEGVEMERAMGWRVINICISMRVMTAEMLTEDKAPARGRKTCDARGC